MFITNKIDWRRKNIIHSACVTQEFVRTIVYIYIYTVYIYIYALCIYIYIYMNVTRLHTKSMGRHATMFSISRKNCATTSWHLALELEELNFWSDIARCRARTDNPRGERHSVRCWRRMFRGVHRAKQFVFLSKITMKDLIKNYYYYFCYHYYHFFKLGRAQPESAQLLQETVDLTELTPPP